MENPHISFVKQSITEGDRARLAGWYLKNTGKNVEMDFVLDVFLWCCAEGQRAADTKNTDIFMRALEEKGKQAGLTKNILSNLFFSHSSLFEIQDNACVKKDRKRGLFIVFEGLDGSGKSTQIRLLEEKLKLYGLKIHTTSEPTNSATGGLIRDTLSNNTKRHPAELAALFLTDRIAHNINPSWGIQNFLNDGITVICDRYYYSSFAYQGMETNLDWVMDINLNCPQIMKPDLCIYLDAEPEKCKKRVDSERVHLEIFENEISVMKKIRAQFLDVIRKLNHMENIVIQSADRPQTEIANDIFNSVISLIQA